LGRRKIPLRLRMHLHWSARNSGCGRSPIASEKLQHVVPKAYQIPLRTYLAQPTQQKLPKPSHLFDLTKDRLTDLFALCVNRSAFDRSKFSAHAFLEARILRNPSPRHRQWLISVFDTPSGYISINLLLRQIGDIVFAEVARWRRRNSAMVSWSGC
jgi:hypothetical protein